MYNSSNEKLSNNDKVLLILIITVIFSLIYAFRLYSLQITQGSIYSSRGKQIITSISELPAQRGEIFDRNAKSPLVINTDSFAVSVTPGEIPREKYDTVISKLANFLGISKTEIDNKIKNRKSFTSIVVKSNVPFSTISNIAENKYDLPGVTWGAKPVRTYLHTESLTHLVGYVGDIDENEITMLHNKGYTDHSIIGKAGIEKQYDLLLQGTPGSELVTKNVSGRIISETPTVIPPKSGKNLVLTIDSNIQKLTEEALGERIGAAVVLKPATGEILAMVSYPYYDNNIYYADDYAAQYRKLQRDPAQPFINRAVQTSYPPASTFKVIMSTAMLQEKAFPSNKKIECKGSIQLGKDAPKHCHVLKGHGGLDLKNALAQSCNVYYWTIGHDYLGIEKIASYAREFGLGQSTKIDLPAETFGRIPTPEEYNNVRVWRGGDTLNCSIGQGTIEATPLQMANMVAMVSNEGTLYKPHLLKSVVDPVTNSVIEEIKPEILTQSSIDESVWKEVQEAMRYTVTDGTPKDVMKNKVVQIACKTGTAEVGRNKQNRWHSWLVAYAPYDAPPEERVCVATIVEAANDWEWWAPFATNLIIQGIFANQTCEEARAALKFPVDRKNVYSGRME